MNTSVTLTIKPGIELSEEEIREINASKNREWKNTSLTESEMKSNVFFLLKDENGSIIAQGALQEVNDVVFNNERFDILGIGGIIANVKGEGYGRRLMTEIREYLVREKKSAVGFTNKFEFYEKCGFSTDIASLKRFVYLKDGERITNTDDEGIVYFDGPDQFMEKVLRNPEEEVFLKTAPAW